MSLKYEPASEPQMSELEEFVSSPNIANVEEVRTARPPYEP